MRENLFHAQRRVALMTMTSLRMAACTSLLGHHKIHNSRATSCLSFCKEKAVFQENSIRNIYRTARGFFLGTGQGSTESRDSRALRGVSARGAGRRLGSALWALAWLSDEVSAEGEKSGCLGPLYSWFCKRRLVDADWNGGK